MKRNVLHGIAVSAGIAIGRAYFLTRKKSLESFSRSIDPALVGLELSRLDAAFETTRREIGEAAQRIPPSLKDQAGILAAHLMICKDPKLIDTARKAIRDDFFSAEWAVETAVGAIAESFSLIEDVYIRERVQDVRAVASRVVGHLRGSVAAYLPRHERFILLAHDLTPADTLELSLRDIAAFATEEGGRTAHTGILARSSGIPAVVGMSGLEEAVKDGDLIILDALEGLAVVDPDPSSLARYTARQDAFASFQKTLGKNAHLPAEMSQGFRVMVRGNIETPDDVGDLVRVGADGIGLYRTEFGFISRPDPPGEDELVDEYSRVLRAVAPGPVTFRTLDVGADKMLWSQKALEEANPALGLRAIRYCLRNQDIFRRQLRAILRASVNGNAKLMFPMISGLRELRLAKAVLGEVKQELDANNIPYDHGMPLGIMIELPAAVTMADTLGREVDFFSIGTNDLIQYSLGIDRTNRHVSYLYQPLHPAVIRSIKQVMDMAHMTGTQVSVCGEMASDPYCLLVLLGMGVGDISMAPQAIPGIKHIIRRTDIWNCVHLMREVHGATTVEAANRAAKLHMSRLFPEELPFYVSVLDSQE